MPFLHSSVPFSPYTNAPISLCKHHNNSTRAFLLVSTVACSRRRVLQSNNIIAAPRHTPSFYTDTFPARSWNADIRKVQFSGHTAGFASRLRRTQTKRPFWLDVVLGVPWYTWAKQLWLRSHHDLENCHTSAVSVLTRGSIHSAWHVQT